MGHLRQPPGGSSADDTFRADTILVWNGNPAYTRIPYYHYLTEARYRGATVVLIAPDFSPSAPHADMHVALRPGSDAALLLSMCGVVIDEGLADLDFVRSQTDLGFLVRADDGRFLREADLVPDGRADRFHLHRRWGRDGRPGQARRPRCAE
ncbi:MAG: molybdopterin-dependent oxidoreductase [Microthrixaceae bacterium]|nr:molybdopterin-dependent oxidoreductase [Microthrixaceae bacterium]